MFRDYIHTGPLQRATISFIMRNLLAQKYMHKYRRTFFYLNESATGEITRDELITSFWTYGMGEVSEYEIDAVLAIVDLDNSGMIGFEEFLMTAISPEDLLTQHSIAKAFKIFDKDGGNSVSVDEIQGQLNKGDVFDISEETWWNIFLVKPSDTLDPNQQLSTSEFADLFFRIFEN